MDGFKNSTKTHYMKGGSCDAYAKGGKVKGAAKISKVMGEFKAGTLHSGSKKGPEVTSEKQAMAIALSEARKAGAKIPVKKAGGGAVSSRPTDSKGRRISDEELSTPERILAKSGRADPYEPIPKTGPAPIKRRPLGRGAAGDIPTPRGVPVAPREPLINRRAGGLAVMPKGGKK